MLAAHKRLAVASMHAVAQISGADPPGRVPETRQNPQPQLHQFRAEALGRTGKKGALYVSFGRYRSEDGVLVERFVESYKSPSEAAAAFEELKKGASRVLAQGWKERPRRGRPGPRVVLEFGRSGKADSQKVIAWTDGATIVRLRSTSLPHLEDFEKQIYPAAEPPAKPQ